MIPFRPLDEIYCREHYNRCNISLWWKMFWVIQTMKNWIHSCGGSSWRFVISHLVATKSKSSCISWSARSVAVHNISPWRNVHSSQHWLMRPGQAVVRVVVGRVVDSAVLEEKLADLRLEVRVWDAIPLRTTLLIRLMSIGWLRSGKVVPEGVGGVQVQLTTVNNANVDPAPEEIYFL